VTPVREADEQELSRAIDEGGAIVVDFWAPWCAQCLAMRGVVDRLADNLDARARVLTVNVEAHPNAAEAHDVKSLPALLLFRDGALRERLDGFQRLPVIMERLRGHLP